MLSIDIPFYQCEIECNCGCGSAIRQPILMRKLAMARWLAGIEFDVNSWNRCLNYNELVGGVQNSEHLEGYAVDISTYSSQMKFLIISAAIQAGFRRIGLYSWGLHLGADPEKLQNVFWIGGQYDDR